ncbi:isoleucine N-monooxygenase 1-like [Solanum verrucosum]|uniref:isoleucine N-monooxygenase 1-like n=1 Tax=Solanum verrucosum TaxID=315347 RepID=UPI0020D1706E|nr:isoleucine N-monooxygenase 1-like [Solanum verrucosum]
MVIYNFLSTFSKSNNNTTLWKIFISTILRKWNSKVRNNKPFPPCPKSWPIIGSLPQIFIKNKTTFIYWIHKIMEEMNTEIACIFLGKVHVIPITSPELACEFLKIQDSIFSSRPICMSASLISNNYLTSVFLPIGDQWIKMRKILASHVLSPTSFQWLRPKRDEAIDDLVQFVYNQCINQQVINLRQVTRCYCGNVIRNMIYNKRSLFGSIEEEEQVDALFTLLKYLHCFGISDYLPWLSVFDLDGHKAIIKKAYDIATKQIDIEVDHRIQIWKDGNKILEEDILDVLIMLKDDNGNPLMNVKEIKAQVLELMLATVDNPSNAVEWTLAEMLNQPKLMQKAIKELNNVVGMDRLVQESDLPRLNYVKACIKEAFRLHPISPFNVPHVSVSDTIIGEKYFIPKGSIVLLSRLGLGRNPRVWKDPLKFKPERHLKTKDGSEVVLTDSKLRLLSFSIGRRGCPAVKLGSTITTMLLARLLQGFTWSLPPNSSCSDLIESSKIDHFCTSPLLARAKPRLANAIYHL